MKIINVMAASIDGRIAAQTIEGDDDRKAIGLSSEEDQIFLQNQMAECDAIIVGASSIRANGECLSHAGRDGVFPTWYIMANKPLPAEYPFWRQKHINRIIISGRPLPIPKCAEGYVENAVYGEEDVVFFITKLMKKKRHKVALLFGGGIVNSLFYDAHMVDELRLTIAPLFIARSSAPYLVNPNLKETVSFHLKAVTKEGDYLFLRYAVIPRVSD